jgi:NADH-quinone oxidoreductase subunit C
LSSSDAGAAGPEGPRPTDDGTVPDVVAPGPDANVESPPAEPSGADAGPGASPTAADRGPIPAPGAPAEPSSDDDRPGQSPDGIGRDAAAEPPAVTVTSDEAADDVPVVEDAVPGATGTAPEGGDTKSEGDDTPAADVAAAGTADGAAPDQPEGAAASAGAMVSAERPDPDSPGTTAAGEAIPGDSSTRASTTTEPPVAEPEPQPTDEERQPLIDVLAERLGVGFVASHVDPGRDLTVRVTRAAWVEAAEVCRDVLGLTYFGFLSAMDWMPSPFGRSEDGGLAAPPTATEVTFEAGTTGGSTRFQLLARLESPKAPSLGITLKCDVPSDDLVAPTWTTVFPGADWHERETAEMFGIDFAGHPHLVKLYLPGAFEGYPMRKDFPLLARDVKPWPGLVDVEPMPGEDESTDDAGAAGAEEVEA